LGGPSDFEFVTIEDDLISRPIGGDIALAITDLDWWRKIYFNGENVRKYQ
jgi:hypothetical protein